MGKLVLGVGRSGALNWCRIGPMGISRLRRRALWLRLRRTLRLRGSRIRLRRIRLRRSGLRGTGRGRDNRCYRDARRSGLRSANGGFAATICLRTHTVGADTAGGVPGIGGAEDT